MPKGIYIRTKPVWNKGLKWSRGYHHSSVTKQRISVALKGNKNLIESQRKRWKLPEERAKQSIAIRKCYEIPCYSERHILGLRKYFQNPDNRAKRAIEVNQWCRSPEHLRRVSDKSKQNWLNPVYRENWLKKTEYCRTIEHMAYMNKCRLESSKPNKPETLLGNILNQKYPNEYQYVGNGKRIINGLIPDFINTDRKEVIEHFGSYWHRNDNPEDRIIRFSNAGFKCLIIWENELRDISTVLNKVKLFREQ